ncbi:hypothetical protein BCY89_27730 [Sphingobacterium siyangense]|uniref:Uncharacterized protein n=1 Tax=Sphingobacterium siyangense TaxID=459529 RepID=A0A420FTT7_9SPHI|nr:hypothetical protein [Sphingobacterium siyangense]RKF36387.1 hypothetical protein BCY89_27730 [Sphingobacterium siyangense]
MNTNVIVNGKAISTFAFSSNSDGGGGTIKEWHLMENCPNATKIEAVTYPVLQLGNNMKIR